MARGPQDGKTNNPNGRPKGIKNKATRDIRELIQRTVDFKELVVELKALATEKKEKWAFEMLMEYGFGKPVEIQIAPMTFGNEEGKAIEHTHTHKLEPGTTQALAELARRFSKR